MKSASASTDVPVGIASRQSQHTKTPLFYFRLCILAGLERATTVYSRGIGSRGAQWVGYHAQHAHASRRAGAVPGSSCRASLVPCARDMRPSTRCPALVEIAPPPGEPMRSRPRVEGDTVLPRGCRLCARGMGLTCVSVHGNLLEEELDERVDHLGGSCCHAPSTAAAVPERGVALDCMAATATATGLGRGSARVPVVSTTNEPHSRTRLCNDQITKSICIHQEGRPLREGSRQA